MKTAIKPVTKKPISETLCCESVTSLLSENKSVLMKMSDIDGNSQRQIINLGTGKRDINQNSFNDLENSFNRNYYITINLFPQFIGHSTNGQLSNNTGNITVHQSGEIFANQCPQKIIDFVICLMKKGAENG